MKKTKYLDHKIIVIGHDDEDVDIAFDDTYCQQKGESSTVLMALWICALLFALGMYFIGRMALESDIRGRCYKSNMSGRTYCDENRHKISDETIKRVVNRIGVI